MIFEIGTYKDADGKYEVEMGKIGNRYYVVMVVIGDDGNAQSRINRFDTVDEAGKAFNMLVGFSLSGMYSGKERIETYEKYGRSK